MPANQKRYRFFLSYARRDLDHYVRKFYQDLAREVSIQSGSDVDSIGFFDQREIEPGDTWPETLAEALRCTRSLVCLLSPTYFGRLYCGKEWTVFSERQEEFIKSSSDDSRMPNLIFPILWVSVKLADRPPPDFVNDIQLAHYELGRDYETWGFRYCLNLGKYRERCKVFITRLAADLLATTNQWNLPHLESLKSIKEVESAFHKTASQSPTGTSISSEMGPRVVQPFCVAGRQREMKSIRRGEFACYGTDKALDWRPYGHDTMHDMVHGNLGADWILQEEILAAHETIEVQLGRSNANNQIALILVDPWTLKRQAYQKAMRAYDEGDFPNATILVIWNLQDSQTAANYDDLKTLVRQTFRRKVRDQDPNVYLEDITSAEEFRNRLKMAVCSVQMKLLEQAPVARKMEGGQVHPQPMVAGPGGKGI
jgi:FxsC-like protein